MTVEELQKALTEGHFPPQMEVLMVGDLESVNSVATEEIETIELVDDEEKSTKEVFLVLR